MKTTLDKSLKFTNITYKEIVTYSVLFLLLYLLGHLLPVGFDWENFFSRNVFPKPWMPWSSFIFHFLDLPAVFAMTVMAIGFRSIKYNKSPIPIIFALTSLPTLWVLFIGNLDGVVLFGFLLLPIGAPLLLTKPQIASFALLANRKSFTVGIIWIFISILVWGFWPFDLLMVTQDAWKALWIQDITLFPWGLIIAIPLLWISRGDEDLLMAAGSFGTPHLFPYTFLVLIPSLARMKPGWMILTWFISWTPLLANWLGPDAWHFGNLMSVCFWLGIYLNKNQKNGKLPLSNTTSEQANLS